MVLTMCRRVPQSAVSKPHAKQRELGLAKICNRKDILELQEQLSISWMFQAFTHKLSGLGCDGMILGALMSDNDYVPMSTSACGVRPHAKQRELGLARISARLERHTGICRNKGVYLGCFGPLRVSSQVEIAMA